MCDVWFVRLDIDDHYSALDALDAADLHAPSTYFGRHDTTTVIGFPSRRLARAVAWCLLEGLDVSRDAIRVAPHEQRNTGAA